MKHRQPKEHPLDVIVCVCEGVFVCVCVCVREEAKKLLHTLHIEVDPIAWGEIERLTF